LIETDKPIDVNQINEYLPGDIVLWATTDAVAGFRPRYNVLMRHYRYYMHFHKPDIDLISMRKATEFLIGSHDFSHLSKPDGDRETTTTILSIHFQTHQNTLVIDVFGTNFLWKLVRKMVTLLLDIGTKKYDYTIARDLIEHRRRIRGGITPASPEGLVLIEAVVPFIFEPSKYAIRRIRKEIAERSDFMTRMSVSLTSLASDFFSDRRFPF
jgi:tRNA pseudouridine38-40 synthase